MVQNLVKLSLCEISAVPDLLRPMDPARTKQPIPRRTLSFWALLPPCLVLGKHVSACQTHTLMGRYRVPTVPDLLRAMDPARTKQPIPRRTPSFWALLPSCLVLGKHVTPKPPLIFLTVLGMCTNRLGASFNLQHESRTPFL